MTVSIDYINWVKFIITEDHTGMFFVRARCLDFVDDRDDRSTVLFWISETKSTCRGDIPILVDYREIIERQKKLAASEPKPSASNLTVAFEVFALV